MFYKKYLEPSSADNMARPSSCSVFKSFFIFVAGDPYLCPDGSPSSSNHDRTE